MKTGKIKIVISALLILILALGLIGCGEKEQLSNGDKESFIIEDADVKFVPEVHAYFWNKTNVEIDGKTYFDYLIEINSDECYSYPTNDLVYMVDSTDGDYKKIETMVQDVKVETYCINKDLGGATDYFIKIRSPKLLDTKKIRISYVGIKKFDANIDLNSYTLGTEDNNFYAATLRLSELDSVVGDGLSELPNKLGEDFIITESNSLFYYFGSSENMFIKDNTLWQKIDINPVNNGDLNKLAENLKYLAFAEFSKDAQTNNNVESIFYDDKYEIKSKVEDGNVYIGFTTADNSKIDESFQPDALVYTRGDEQLDENKLTNLDECKELCTFFKINYGE